MLINLASAEEQLEVMHNIHRILRPGGRFFMIENSTESHSRINIIRQALGLTERPPASFNVFINEKRVIEPFKKTMKLEHEEHFGGIHDLFQYVVQPALNDGQIEYDTALMTRLTDALLAMSRNGIWAEGRFGQNVLWVWRKGGG